MLLQVHFDFEHLKKDWKRDHARSAEPSFSSVIPKRFLLSAPSGEVFIKACVAPGYKCTSYGFPDAFSFSSRPLAAYKTRPVTLVGVTGYCMGGALAIASSVLVPGIDAAVAFYGVPPTELADATNIKVPVQAHFGECDNVVGFSDITRIFVPDQTKRSELNNQP
uniref:Carboxymethylenebutenolidase homolog n=1 Tax=Tanacetum cinerariifolium TaxID=118510 RepID=A0A6L2KLI4_TANCI|nr:carboxymethylenebutenolidase homolog [Tanacetum cinerariifolium]